MGWLAFCSICSGNVASAKNVAKQLQEHFCLQINYYAMQNTEANFEDPQRFWPERWLRSSGTGAVPEENSDNLSKLTDERDPLARAFLPYSAGPRSCIGQPLAMMEVRELQGLLAIHLQLWISHSSASLC